MLARKQVCFLEHSSYTLIYPHELAPRVSPRNISASPETGMTKEGLETLTWSFDKLMPLKFESMGPLHGELVPKISAAPLNLLMMATKEL